MLCLIWHIVLSCVPYIASFSGLYFLIAPSSCVPYVASFSGLSFLIAPSSCVPYVASFSGLYFLIAHSSCVPYVASFSGLYFLIPPSVLSNVYYKDTYDLTLKYPSIWVTMDKLSSKILQTDQIFTFKENNLLSSR